MDIKKKNFITKKGYKDLNVIHYKESDGTEFWSVYDENGNIIYDKSSEGIEHFYEYDEKGNEIHYKDSEGFEEWNEYDENGNCIHCRKSNGFESWDEYNENGNLIHYKDSTGYEYWNEYDENGNWIHCRDTDGFERYNEYDENGNEIDKPTEVEETNSMIERKTWEEFRESKLLWLVNTILHVFGWAIVIEKDNRSITAYPARVKFRGFSEEINTQGYIGLSKYMKEHCEELLEEAKE